MVTPERSYTAGSQYRYGFNGQERSSEVDQTGNINTAQFWEYDSRIGRRWNVDIKRNASVSDYACLANNPIWFSDPRGDTAAVRVKKNEYRYVDNHWIDAKTRKVVNLGEFKDGQAKQLMENYSELNTIEDYSPNTTKINASLTTVLLSSWNGKGGETDPFPFLNGNTKEIKVNINLKGSYIEGTAENLSNSDPKANRGNPFLSSLILMGHELGHVFNLLDGRERSYFFALKDQATSFGILRDVAYTEVDAMYWENVVRIHSNVPIRVMYENKDKAEYMEGKILLRGSNNAEVEYKKDAGGKIIETTITDSNGTHTAKRKY